MKKIKRFKRKIKLGWWLVCKLCIEIPQLCTRYQVFFIKGEKLLWLISPYFVHKWDDGNWKPQRRLRSQSWGTGWDSFSKLALGTVYLKLGCPTSSSLFQRRHNKHKEREKKRSDFFILLKSCESWSTTLIVYSKYLNTQCKGPCLQSPSGNDSAC